MNKKIDSIKHTEEKRVLIPSSEEAGTEINISEKDTGSGKLKLPLNPIVSRGDDPELFWLNKYGNDDREELLNVDIRSLYRHEHISPEVIFNRLYQMKTSETDQESFFSVNELFGNMFDKDELEKISSYYKHYDGWTNRIIQGDSLLVMTSLLEKEGMAGQVQTIYMDPPYGIKYGSNWQVKMNNRDVKDGNDDSLAGEPEVIKAYRDTWELGVHSYLSYLRDRLIVAKELLNESGSCFVQISDENVHLVRCIMDEVFGSENFVSLISFTTTSGFPSNTLSRAGDYIVWYAKNSEKVKFRKLYRAKQFGEEGSSPYQYLEMPNFERMSIKDYIKKTGKDLDVYRNGIDFKIFSFGDTVSKGAASTEQQFLFHGEYFTPGKNNHWKANFPDGMRRLAELNRLSKRSNGGLAYIRYFSDFPYVAINNLWSDTGSSFIDKHYVVQTNTLIVLRCLLMTTDPGDLVLDPTCGSGTTAYVAEQWGRRWITIDTSRISINVAKQRLLSAVFPYYKLYDENTKDIRQGFIYKQVPHITLKSLANNESPEMEILYDQPETDKKILRVSGAFTVETLQSFDPVSPESLKKEKEEGDSAGFQELIRDHLVTAGIKNGRKDEKVVFSRVELLPHTYLHAEGFYQTETGEKKAYFHIGPKFGTVTRYDVNEAIKEFRQRGGADWLVVLAFSFHSDVSNLNETTSIGTFEVTKVRMNDDLLQDGLKKKPSKNAASFVTIGEPDIAVNKEGETISVEILGMDIYDPIKDIIKPRDRHDIAYWMVDDDYDGSNFIVRQVFFCGGDKDEFEKWRKGLSNLAKESTKKKAEMTLRIEIDDDAFDRLYGFISHPIKIKGKGHKVAVRVISQYGEESTKVFEVN